MFKKKGLAGLSAPGGGVHKVAPISMPSAGDSYAPAEGEEPNPGMAEDGSSAGEHIGMEIGKTVSRRPRGLGRLGPK